MYKSQQEKILHYITSSSFGGDYAFCPRLYNNNREPADIAWVFENKILLFYCTSGKQSRQKQDNHNIKQSKNWIRHWKQGAILKGSSKNKDFAIKYSNTNEVYIILISNSRDSDDLFEINFEIEGVQNIASMSHNFIEQFFFMSPNVKDFIYVIDFLKEVERASVNDTLSVLLDACEFAFTEGVNVLNQNIKIEYIIGDVVEITKQIKMGLEGVNLNFDLCLAEINWISGVVEAGKNYIKLRFDIENMCTFAWASINFGSRTIIVLVSANLKISTIIIPKLLDRFGSDNFLIFHSEGHLPDISDFWEISVASHLK